MIRRRSSSITAPWMRRYRLCGSDGPCCGGRLDQRFADTNNQRVSGRMRATSRAAQHRHPRTPRLAAGPGQPGRDDHGAGAITPKPLRCSKSLLRVAREAPVTGCSSRHFMAGAMAPGTPRARATGHARQRQSLGSCDVTTGVSLSSLPRTSDQVRTSRGSRPARTGRLLTSHNHLTPLHVDSV